MAVVLEQQAQAVNLAHQSDEQPLELAQGLSEQELQTASLLSSGLGSMGVDVKPSWLAQIDAEASAKKEGDASGPKKEAAGAGDKKPAAGAAVKAGTKIDEAQVTSAIEAYAKAEKDGPEEATKKRSALSELKEKLLAKVTA